MELLSVLVLLVVAVGTAVGTAVAATFVVTLWYGQFYWRPVTWQQHAPRVQWLVYWLLAPLRRFCRHGTALVQLPAQADGDAAAAAAAAAAPLLLLGEPHGLLVLSGCLSFLGNPRAGAELALRAGSVRVGVHRHLLRVPFVRDLLGALGCVSVGSDSLTACWAAGLSTLVFPEGVNGLGARLVAAPPVLPAVRLAYDYGIGIALVEFAGERNVFRTYGNERMSWLRRVTYALLGVPVTFCCCRWRRPRLVTHFASEVLRPLPDEPLAAFAARYTAARTALRAATRTARADDQDDEDNA